MPVKNKRTSINLGLITGLEASAVTIKAHDNDIGADVAVAITEDGVLTVFNTPHTFSLIGSHTFTVPASDLQGHPFTQWSTGATSPTITVTQAGTYTAYYQHTAKYVKSISITQNNPSTDALVDDVSILVGASQKVTNGDFEAGGGSLNGWTVAGNVFVWTTDYHSPSTSARIAVGSISQTLNLTQKVTSFTLWSLRHNACPTFGNLHIVITYTDNSTTVIDHNVSGDVPWTQLDFTSSLTDG